MSDGSDIDAVSKKASAALGKYVTEALDRTKSEKYFTIHVAARLSALTSYQDHWVQPPTKMCWLLLALHQLFFEDIAIAHPDLCGYAGVAPQSIRQAVNGDLGRIFTLAEGEEQEDRQVEYLKVSVPQ